MEKPIRKKELYDGGFGAPDFQYVDLMMEWYASLEAIKKDLGETDILKTIQGSAPLQMAVAIVIVVVVLGIFQILGHDARTA